MAVQPFGADTTTGQMPAVVEGRIKALIGGASANGNAVNAPDSITEWWVGPQAVSLSEPYSRIVFGSVGANDGTAAPGAPYTEQVSPIYANEWAPTTGTKQVKVGTVVADDHNAPALWARNGRRSLMVWTNHGLTNALHCVVSDQAGSIESFAVNPIQLIDTGYQVAYAQIFRIEHLSDAAQDTFWVFHRSASNRPPFVGIPYAVQVVSLDQATGVLTPISNRTFSTHVAGGETGYLSVADAHAPTGQILRVAQSYNPSDELHAVNYFEIDCVTGTITSPHETGFTANMDGTNLPIRTADRAPVLAEPDADHSRRLFYVRPGPMEAAIAYADWAVAAPDSATIKTISLNRTAGTWGDVQEYGTAGKRVGYVAASNYLPGVAFPDPAYDDTLVVAREAAGVSTIEEFRTVRGQLTNATLATSTEARLIRPFVPQGGSPFGALYCHVTSYSPSTYRDYQSSIRSAARAAVPAVEPEVPPVIEDELLLGAGSLLLLDFAHPLEPSPTGAVSGTVFPNLARTHAAAATGLTEAQVDGVTLTSTFVSDTQGKFERTAKGGLHGIASQTLDVASPAQYGRLLIAADLLAWLDAHSTDDLFVSMWGRITRDPLNAGSGTYYLNAGLAGGSGGQTAWNVVGQSKSTGNPAGQPATTRIGLRASREDNGNVIINHAVSDKPSNWGTTVVSRNIAKWGQYPGAPLHSTPSWVLYRLYIEDLSVSGRTYAQVDALDHLAYQQQVLSPDGRYGGDTVPTDPTTVP